MNETAASSDVGLSSGLPPLNLTSHDTISVAEQNCDEYDAEMYALYEMFAWWTEGVIQIVLGSLGFLANAVAVPILLSREMSSVFNRCLTCLAIFDNVFIVCSILEAIRKHLYQSQFQVGNPAPLLGYRPASMTLAKLEGVDQIEYLI